MKKFAALVVFAMMLAGCSQTVSLNSETEVTETVATQTAESETPETNPSETETTSENNESTEVESEEDFEDLSDLFGQETEISL